MPQPGDAGVEVREQRRGAEPRQSQPRRERILQGGKGLPEDVEHLLPTLTRGPVALEEQRRQLRLDIRRGTVCDGQEVSALVVGALGGVLLPALRVDESRGRIGKGAGLRVARARDADRVDMEHPAIAKRDEARVHLAGQDRQLFGARRVQIRARIRPGGQEGPVLEKDHAVVHEGGVAEEIGEASGMRTSEPEHQSATEG